MQTLLHILNDYFLWLWRQIPKYSWNKNADRYLLYFWVSYLKLICFLHKVPFVFSSFCDGIYLGFTQIMVTGLLKHWGLLGNFVPLINVDASRHQAFKDQPEIGQESHFECRCLECIVYWPIDGASVWSPIVAIILLVMIIQGILALSFMYKWNATLNFEKAMDISERVMMR